MSQSRVQISNGVIYKIWQDDCRNVRSTDDDDAQLAFFSSRWILKTYLKLHESITGQWKEYGQSGERALMAFCAAP